MTRRTRVDLEPELPRAGKIFGVVVFLLLVGIAVAVFWTAVQADAAAPKVAHRNIYVHHNPGPWAYELNDVHTIAPRGTAAAHKIRAAVPGDYYTLHRANTGRFKVIAVIWSPPSVAAARPWDHQLTIRNAAFEVFLERAPR